MSTEKRGKGSGARSAPLSLPPYIAWLAAAMPPPATRWRSY